MTTFVRQSLVSFLISGALVLLVFVFTAGASKDDIIYPVRELGGCKNETQCFAYCNERDNLERVKACIAFAKKHELLSAEELEEADYYVTVLGVTSGPGECKNRASCDQYCEDTAHLDECLDFAEKYTLWPQEEISEGRNIARILKEGANLPGGCRTRLTCESYCEDPAHMKECVAFGEKAGFISSEEAEEARKIIPLLEQGEKTPGNCGRKEACEAYCYDPSHIDECLVFAEKAGLLPPDELADAKKVAQFIKNGETPGGCKRRAECETYCADTAHFEECVEFGRKAGLMSEEDAELARKVKGRGPGGCTSRNECESFCRDPLHEEECRSFAKEHGLEDLAAEIEKGAKAEVEGEVTACLEKPCEEMIACFQKISKKTGGDDAGLSPASKGKLDACVAEITETLKARGIPLEHSREQPEAGGTRTVPENQPVPPVNAPEEVQRRYQEEYKKEYERQYQEEYQRRFQEEYERQRRQLQPQ